MAIILFSFFIILLSVIINSIIGLNDFSATILIVFYMIGYIILISKDEKTKKFSICLALGLLIRVVLLYFDQFGRSIYHLPNSGADSEMFYYESVRLATEGYVKRDDNFIFLMGSIMKYTGISRLFTQFIVVIYSLISLVFTTYTIQDIEISDNHKTQIIMTVCLLPNYAILGSIFLRESIVAMFVAISFRFFVMWFNQKKDYYFLFSILCAFGGAFFHSGAIGIAVGYICVRLMYDKKTESMHISGGNIILTGILIILFTVVINRFGDVLLKKIVNIDSIQEIANTLDKGGSSYARYVGNSDSIASIILFTPIRILYFLFSPFPWQWRGISDIIAFLFSSIYYLAIVIKSISTIHRIKKGENKTRLFLMAVIALAVVFVFSWGVSNTGTAARHRDKLVPLFAVLWAYTSMEYKEKEKKSDLNVSKYIR